MNVSPGEPIPPGFENEVSRVAEIQKVIQTYKGNALIGLEYAIELHDNKREPRYMCVLCDKRCDPRTIVKHWTSYGHRLEYMSKHFPTAIKELEPVRNKLDKMKIFVQLLSEAIERHHGRLPLSVCSGDEFNRNKSNICNDIETKFHFDEQNGPNFVNIIDRSLLQSTAQQKVEKPLSKSEDLDEISSDSDGGRSSKRSKVTKQANAVRAKPYEKHSPSKTSNGGEGKQKVKFPTPRELSLQASHIAQERYKWEKYRCLLEIFLKQAEKTFKEYDKNPEAHPLYPEEWKAFWNRRYKELQKEKKVDPNIYDYGPEWAVYWTKRRKELFDIEVEKRKKEIRTQLQLPEDAEDTIKKLKEKYEVSINKSSPDGTNGAGTDAKHVSNPNDNVIDISDDEPPKSHQNRHSHSHSRSTHRSRSISPRSRIDSKRPRNRSKSRSLSPLSDDCDYESRNYMHGKSSRSRVVPSSSLASFSSRRYPPSSMNMDYRDSSYSLYRHSSAYGGHAYSIQQHYEGSLNSPLRKQEKDFEPEPEEEGPLTVVSVLRLLTALEDILGSLGPKVVNLLGKALALDNVKANSADELLLNEDNCVFFETAKEKLKGLLIAEVIEDQQKVRAVKKAIKNIAAIVHQVTSKGKSAEKKEDTTITSTGGPDLSSNRGKINKAAIKDLPFDRQLVASKLAAALVMQGREDLSTEDVDKLIYFFILMVKLSKDKFELDGTPLHMKDVCGELGIKKPPSEILGKQNQKHISSFVDDMDDDEVIDAEASNEKLDKRLKNDSGNNLESLTDSDLQTLLQNFKHLSTEEQHHLIAHLKKLETSDPARVEKLRKFVNLGDLAETVAETTYSNPSSSQRGRNDASSSSVASNRASTIKHRSVDSPRRSLSRDLPNDSDEDNSRSAQQHGINVSNPNKFSLDDEDDDDYNFDEVLKAASSFVDGTNRERQANSSNRSLEASSSKTNYSVADPPAPGTSKSTSDPLTFNRAAMNSSTTISLSDTQSLIANLMGNLQQTTASMKQTNQEPFQQDPKSLQNMPQSNMQYYQSYDQQNYPQQYPQQQQFPQQQQYPLGYGPMQNNQMGYMGNDQRGYYGYNNYSNYPNQQWSGGFNGNT